jgi:hypothetical protein
MRYDQPRNTSSMNLYNFSGGAGVGTSGELEAEPESHTTYASSIGASIGASNESKNDLVDFVYSIPSIGSAHRDRIQHTEESAPSRFLRAVFPFVFGPIQTAAASHDPLPRVTIQPTPSFPQGILANECTGMYLSGTGGLSMGIKCPGSVVLYENGGINSVVVQFQTGDRSFDIYANGINVNNCVIPSEGPVGNASSTSTCRIYQIFCLPSHQRNDGARTLGVVRQCLDGYDSETKTAQMRFDIVGNIFGSNSYVTYIPEVTPTTSPSLATNSSEESSTQASWEIYLIAPGSGLGILGVIGIVCLIKYKRRNADQRRREADQHFGEIMLSGFDQEEPGTIPAL